MYRLSGIDILTNTYKHNNKESKPDKIFTNTIVDIKISPIYNIRLLTRPKVVANITNKIEILIKKDANIIRTLNINEFCAALHNIILSGSSNFNPVFQHIRRARERTRNNIKFLYERLYKEVKRLTKNLPDTDTRDLKVEHIGLEASQLEAIMNFHGNGIPNNRQNNNKELLNNFILKGSKAGGISGIKNEFLKILPRNFIVELTYMFNKIITDTEISMILKKHMIQPILKGDSEQEAGFRLKHSTLNQALTLDTRLRHSNGEEICVTLDYPKPITVYIVRDCTRN
ncbi:hypothetical protein CWI36_2317p0010 [Hamiltosporidium magnivora]|uniref:Uncharacterized protein n=1 Tax=Hamiltosporidium magnivora TaxID=148818 RepID=A0A4Q9KVJ5_9MICR|nr:hypothetical protein CWI36_2317p0010 [Hamiltosporidium magnivora]